MTMKLPLKTLSVLIPAACAVLLSPGSVAPASATALLAPALTQKIDEVAKPPSRVLKVHSSMHSNCANHHGSYHKHVRVRPRRCVEWAATGSSDSPTIQRICTRWVYLPTRFPPRYKSVRCSR